MAKLTRKQASLFAPNAGFSGIETFGAKEQTGTYAGQTVPDPTNIQSLSAWTSGWSAAQFEQVFAPYYQDRNAVDFVNLYQAAYILQQGIAEWDSGTSYFINSICSFTGQLFMSLQDFNQGNSPSFGTSNAFWKYLQFASLSTFPTRTVFTSGSGTYTPPAMCTRIFVRMVGGGGGGSGLSGGTGSTAGGNGGTTTLGSLSCTGGAGGSTFSSGGIATGGDININGTQPSFPFGSVNPTSSSKFGGAGTSFYLAISLPATSASQNSGSGGGTGGGLGLTGGAGGYLEKTINNPGPMNYVVGTGGTAGPAGGSGSGNRPGGAGGSGVIIIDEFYF